MLQIIVEMIIPKQSRTRASAWETLVAVTVGMQSIPSDIEQVMMKTFLWQNKILFNYVNYLVKSFDCKILK